MEFNAMTSSIPIQNPCVIGQCLTAMNEQRLVSAARAGDGSAFSELYARNSRKVMKRVYGITKNREDAEDVIQDAALRAFVNFKSFEGRSSFSSWLTRIAINSALMSLRKKNKAEISIDRPYDNDDSSRLWEPSDNAETPEARYARCEREELVAAAIERLPLIFREILELQVSNDYSIIQIAEALGISVAAAKSRLMRARRTLQRVSKTRIHGGTRSNSSRESLKPRIHTGSAVRGQMPPSGIGSAA